MNIITNADVSKFIKLLKAGLKDGRNKEMTCYNGADSYKGMREPRDYFIKLEFSCLLDASVVDELFVEESIDITNQVNELLK